MTRFDTPFPHADRRTLKNPPIELIIAQVRFPALAELFVPQGFVSFAARIREEYPNGSPLNEVELEFTPERIHETGRKPLWRFEDMSRRWTLTLAPEFLALETREYQSFSNFRDRFVSAWNNLIDTYKIKYRTRLGLRYVDRFATDKQASLPENWFALIAPSIFPMRTRDLDLSQSGNLAHSFSITESLSLTFQSAFRWREIDGVRSDEFVLDLDCFDPSQAMLSGDTADRLDELKEVAHNAFWWTFGKLLNTIEPNGTSDD